MPTRHQLGSRRTSGIDGDIEQLRLEVSDMLGQPVHVSNLRLPAVSQSRSVVVLAGGTGGAMLARGMADVVGSEQLTVIANTGDDIEIYGAHVSPDPDLITFWLADRIDAQGWGLEGDSSHVMDALRELGEEIWFNLGDADLAIGIQRAAALRSGMRLTEAQALLAAHLAPLGQVLPMSDHPVRTRVLAGGRWWPLQEFLIRARGKQGEIEVEDVLFRGARVAGTTPEVLAMRSPRLARS